MPNEDESYNYIIEAETYLGSHGLFCLVWGRSRQPFPVFACEITKTLAEHRDIIIPGATSHTGMVLELESTFLAVAL